MRYVYLFRDAGIFFVACLDGGFTYSACSYFKCGNVVSYK